ncbi:glycoside hydrolase family 97 protein [Sphingomonas sp. SUN019]|uniref:glycoside hydrolase family 97 protein n=1 Tax=Sphingomonas sp. SUN019 TaxID=2937788 RepID=UPI002164E8A5|nr:glycoside hydrolase family 97 protein [Sphingomonas sp. SUN019]UVO51869.1 glycoside hydrolase family 97 protein [Sphingomonas sp. SUN019]
MRFRISAALALAALTGVSSTAIAQTDLANKPAANVVAKGASPDGKITVTVGIDGDGRPSYAVQRGGKPLLTDSRLGFMFTDAPKIERGLELAGTKRDRADTTWTQPYGEWKTIRDKHNELTVTFREKANLKREMAVTFRIFDDGVGFRYTLPKQANLTQANIAEELTQFAIAEPGTAWWKPAFEWNREEYLYNKTPLDAVGTAQTVMTVKLASGTHLALHEAALVDYSAMNLARGEGTTFRAALTPGAGAPKVSRAAGFSTPWRTIAIADDAPGLYMNHMILNLNEPNKLGDVSWIKPGKFVGVWWNMIKGDWSWARGAKHGATNAHVRQYIDFAAANRIPGVLVEGWNVGWDGDWFGNGNDMNFSQPTEDFDANGLAAYAKSKGVYLIGHHETGGSVSNYDRQLDTAYKFAADHGEPVVKTGYVTDAGQIERVDPDGSKHREWHEGQWMVNHHLRVVQTAAKYRVGVDAHEPVKDTGLRRTYPNWLAREGGRGMEYNAWPGKNPPEHEANMVFTQFLGGPMDFTPGVLSLTGQGGSPILSTIAKQLALYVVLYSPVVMAADTPENYAKYPAAFKFIRDVPTDWSDTRALNGEVGDYATIARKDAKSNDWYLGAVGDEQPRQSTVTLDFLDAGRSYTAEIYCDGPAADYRTDARHSITIETKQVRKGDTMTLSLAPGGGTAVRFVASGGKRRR